MSLINLDFDPFYALTIPFFEDKWIKGHSSSVNTKFSLDMIEKDNSYVFNAEIPGVDKKDISISTRDGILTISFKKKKQKEENGDNYHFSERSYGSFSRSISLPRGIDIKNTQAKYENGVLSVCIAKTEESKLYDIHIV